MSLSWQAEVWGGMKDNGVSRSEMASELSVTPEYVSSILNKKRAPARAETNFKLALRNIVAKKQNPQPGRTEKN